MANLVTTWPVSSCTIRATSDRVVWGDNVLIRFPLGVCSLSLAWAWVVLGFAAGGGAGASGSIVLPSRAALASSALRRRSALSASILALILFLASRSSCFSWRFRAASLICSLRASSSLTSCVSLVDFSRICCTRE